MPAADKLAKDPTKLTGVNVVLLLGKDIAANPIAGAPATTVAVTATTAAATATATTAAAKTTATTKK